MTQVQRTPRAEADLEEILQYRLRGDVVQILRILHGNRDLQRILREEEPGDD